MPALDERDWVNPYLSPLRLWLMTQLANVFPNTARLLKSNDKTTQLLFTEWTGHTQSSLEKAWETDGFKRTPVDPANPKKYRPAWTRVSGNAVTTSCEGLVNKVVQKLKQNGFGGPQLKLRKPIDSFNLAGLTPGTGKEPATQTGWYWAREISDTLYPQPGDLFQVGTPFINPGQWTLHHVGVITTFTPGLVPKWMTIEAGQGGPAAGADWAVRKPYRPVNPIDPAKPKKVFMGWLSLEEYFDV
jgi:hypothetical protein